MNIFNNIKEVIINILKDNIEKENSNILSAITCEQPKNLKFGDVSSNVLMLLKKKDKKYGKEFQYLFIKNLKASGLFDKVDYKEPGFLNFTLKKVQWFKLLLEIHNNNNYGFSNIGKGKKVNIEFISANPTGPLHVGHLRGAVFGDVLAKLMIKNGYNVTKEYYINDLGNQIDNLFDTVKTHILNQIQNSNIKLSENMYKGKYLESIASQIIKEGKSNLSDLKLKDFVIEKVLDLIKNDLERLGVKFDSYVSEKELSGSGYIKKTIDQLEKSNYLYRGFLEKPKAFDNKEWTKRKQLLFKSVSFGDDSDRPVKRNNGEWTYFASDIAYHNNKVLRGYDEIINIWGADHAGYIKRVDAALKALGHTEVKFTVKLCQIVNLLENNKAVKMSKRSGNYVLAKEIIDKIGKDVIRFFMLTRKNDAHLDFDLSKAVEESKENPIFYIQYAIARVNSLNRIIKEKKISIEDFDISLFNKFNNNELDIIKTLSLWPKIIDSSVQFQEPHRIVYYLIELASLLHNYWSIGNSDKKMRIINQVDNSLTQARVILVNGICSIIRSGLDIISIKPMEKM